MQAAAGQDAVRIIDIRDPKAYGERHIPGALNAPYGKWRGPATNPGELPELPKLTELVRELKEIRRTVEIRGVRVTGEF